eukprot:gnl/Spiro4/6343_TR3269_c0_g2_i1.p1 gnl/Spiro4/6343_TR3269_c0_g2~~gnl/Spiro4/6343_TR3269_c0_g2_i1.p1  ORF type:complete len:336 (-),score=69.12 gnl/Spiro4/6343_TR3269_c0_g2_i1:53-1018(-)
MGDATAFPTAFFGTMGRDAESDSTMHSLVANALASGYRAFDMAELYTTAAAVGAALRESGIPRDQLYIASKLKGLPEGDYSDVVARVRAMLAQAQLEYFDLLLIHWPGPATVDMVRSDPEQVQQTCSFEQFEQKIATAWAMMLRLREEGLVREVGVSNFYLRHLQKLLELCPTPSSRPYANQIYIDAANPENPLVEFMQANGIKPIAYRPLAFLNVLQMVGEMGDESFNKLQELCPRAGSPNIHSLILSWLSARGIAYVTQSSTPERSAANLQAGRTTLAAVDGVPPAQLVQLGDDSREMVLSCGGEDAYAKAFAGSQSSS